MNEILKVLTLKRVVILALVIMLTIWALSDDRTGETVTSVNADVVRPSLAFDHHYHRVKTSWVTHFPKNVHHIYPASSFGLPLISGNQYNYDFDVVRLNERNAVQLEVNVLEAGQYVIALDHLDISTSILANRIALKVNGDFQYEESRVIELPTTWNMLDEPFSVDRYGNEIMPNGIKSHELKTSFLHDMTALNAAPLTFDLKEGLNTIEITHLRGDIILGAVHIKSVRTPLSYHDYLNQFNAELVDNALITVGAESFISITNPATRLRSERDPSATSYDTRYLKLNAIDGWSFRRGNDTITYEVEVFETGFYYLNFKYRQNYLMQMPVFREIKINGEVPFEELQMVPFQFTNSFENFTLNNGEENYKIYLEEGINEISLRVVLEPYRNSFHHVVSIMEEMTELSLEIKRLTGNTTDRFRNWRLESYIPDVKDRLTGWIETLEHVQEGLLTYSEFASPGELTNIVLAITQLNRLLEDVDDIPNNMTLLADGDSSTAQLLGTTAQVFLENGLDLEQFHVSGTDRVPRARANIFVNTYESIRRFFLSFIVSDYRVDNVDDDTIEIWVNYPRQYVEIMQQIIDSEFTPQTGIRVQLSIMPDENKLILANAANRAPDIALGVNHWLPYEFAIRGASLDLRQFEGYEDLVGNFARGAMIPYAFEDGMYGLPLTQNFWVTFYREDILSSLDIPVPDTWDEVIEILPELQRFGMNFFQPISMFGGFKPFVSTIPFIYQFGGSLYDEDGLSTILNSEENIEGVRMMTELFTIYDVPKQVPNFYNHFRTGLLPIGISDLATYLQLTIAAPEIAGQWNIAPHPGVKNSEGVVERWAASGAQSLMIMSTTQLPQESWSFVEWWMSTETQVNFATRLQTAYGTEFLWNTANLEAFAQIALPEEHIEVILAQWEFALEASRIPGAYMVERELSNAWNRIVFNDANPRVSLDQAVRIANREIIYRMEEFGYAVDGVGVKPYLVPTIHNIDYWLKEHDYD